MEIRDYVAATVALAFPARAWHRSGCADEDPVVSVHRQEGDLRGDPVLEGLKDRLAPKVATKVAQEEEVLPRSPGQ